MKNRYKEALNNLWKIYEINEIKGSRLMRSALDELGELIDNYWKLEKAFDDACKLLDTIEYSRYKEGRVKEQVYENRKPWKEKLLAFYDKKVQGND